MNCLNNRELQQIALNDSVNIEFKDVCKGYTKEFFQF